MLRPGPRSRRRTSSPRRSLSSSSDVAARRARRRRARAGAPSSCSVVVVLGHGCVFHFRDGVTDRFARWRKDAEGRDAHGAPASEVRDDGADDRGPPRLVQPSPTRRARQRCRAHGRRARRCRASRCPPTCDALGSCVGSDQALERARPVLGSSAARTTRVRGWSEASATWSTSRISPKGDRSLRRLIAPAEGQHDLTGPRSLSGDARAQTRPCRT